MLVLLCLSLDEVVFVLFSSCWNLKPVICISVVFMHECTWVIYSSVCLCRELVLAE